MDFETYVAYSIDPVQSAKDIEEALRLFEARYQQKPDLVVLHTKTICPDLAGIEICREDRNELSQAVYIAKRGWDPREISRGMVEEPPAAPAKATKARVEPAKVAKARAEPAKVAPSSVEPAKTTPATPTTAAPPRMPGTVFMPARIVRAAALDDDIFH